MILTSKWRDFKSIMTSRFACFTPSMDFCYQITKAMSKRFVLNDEAVKNTYGFRVLTEGIKTDTFLKNPVCLRDHKNDTDNVIGTWQDLRREGGKLTASVVFDTDNEVADRVAKKVEKGLVRGCSMGVSFDYIDMEKRGGEQVLTKCELYEASIVPVPANPNTIAVYNAQGKLLSEAEIKQLTLTKKSSENHKEFKTMKNLKSYLQLAEDADETAAISAVKEIELRLRETTADRDRYKKQIGELEAAEKARLKADFEKEADAAVKDGRLDAKGKAAVVEMAEGKYDKAKALLNSLPKHKSVAAVLKSDKDSLARYDKMSFDELDRGGHLANLKADHKDYFVERYEREFGKKPSNV